MTYDVRWHAAGTSAARAIEVHATDHLGAPGGSRGGDVTSGRLCPRCGSSAHGRPWLRVDGVAHHVSLSRAGQHLVTALSDGPVGVDVKSVAAVAAGWDPTLVLAAGETAGSDTERARVWARKEAVLKQRGTGLATPMTGVLLTDEQWRDLEAPEGYVAAISWAGPAAAAP